MDRDKEPMLYLNNRPVDVTIFPDNTSQVWKIPNLPELQQLKLVEIKWGFTSEGEIAHLGQLKMLLHANLIRASLHLTYLPYGRQDKDIGNESTFALRNFAHAINALAFEYVEILDPHSEMALELIRKSRAIYPFSQLQNIILGTGATLVCYPDKGALTKYSSVYKDIVGSAHIFGEKVRDQLTGNITSYKVLGECYGENVLIVDDICDGGATFKILAKDLLANGANSVSLFVTHGLFTKGLETLKESGISRIFCQDGECFEEPGAHWWTERL